MKNAISGALSGALCLFSSACLAGYQSCGNQVVGDNVSTCPDGSIPSYHAGQISAPAPQPRQAQAVQPYRSQSEPHLFTRQEREEMLRNDDKAGRTHNSMSKGAGARTPGTAILTTAGDGTTTGTSLRPRSGIPTKGLA